jgi:Threonine dehydrogenase and related Zn-dependent dehydrogenases
MTDVIHSKAYRLIEPGKFKETVIEHKVKEGEVVVQPILASICHADLRYYTGKRRKEALNQKLPMALFHEGIGEVVISKDEFIQVGQKVAIVPSIPGYRLEQKKKEDCCESCRRNVADNYCKTGVFLGSGYDGIGQEFLVLPSENVVPIPEKLKDEIAVLAELCSVSLHALNHLKEEDFHKGKIAVFGDGPVGYLTAAMLYHYFHIPKSQLLVFGAVEEKLNQFDFATVHLVNDFPFLEAKGVTVAIECTGGKFSESAINQAIDLLEPEGKLILMGVTEQCVPINTRDVLEKGLQLYGSSRSSSEDFKTLMQAFLNEDYQKTLSKLIPEKSIAIRNAEDLKKAMDEAAEHKGWKKTYLSFSWN